ncbi:MAG: ankyrin repeat domain-containing protein [Akkermansiaceae bacterium]|nr:ankyrin repeat domain-containing protein [Armatimonadota bacterium]
MPTASDAEALHIAASRGDAAQVVRLLESGADVEARDARGRTPLLVAAREGRADAARLLLEAGAAVDARGESMSITPLMASAQRGDVALVRLLLEAAADPNAAARNGAGVLARAVIGGNLVVAKALLDAGADPDGAGSSAPPNTSPLWVAVAMKKRDLVNLLLERGANTNTGDSVSDTPFGVAVSGGDATIARMLLEAGADPLRPALSNLPLLAVAIRFTNLPMAELLEEYGLSLAKSDTPNVVTTAERMMLAEAEDRKNKPFAG